MAIATSDVIWLISLLKELKVYFTNILTIQCDNSSVVVVATNPILHSKFKHIELDLFFVREKVAYGSLPVGEVPACGQVTYIITKPFSTSYFTHFRQLL